MAIWVPPVRKFDTFIIPDTGIQNNRFSHLNTKISNSNLSVSKAFRSPFPAAADQNRHRDLPAIWANLWACFTCSGQERIYRVGAGWIATAWTGGVSRGENPLGSGFPIGASSSPVGTRFSVGKSSVLYLCFRLTLERGWLRHLRHRQIEADRRFSAAVGQADFVTTVLTQMQNS